MHAIIPHPTAAIGRKGDVLAVIWIIISCGPIRGSIWSGQIAAVAAEVRVIVWWGTCNCAVRYFYIIYIIYISIWHTISSLSRISPTMIMDDGGDCGDRWWQWGQRRDNDYNVTTRDLLWRLRYIYILFFIKFYTSILFLTSDISSSSLISPDKHQRGSIQSGWL